MAPIMSGLGITRTQVNNYFSDQPKPSASPKPPTITKANVLAITVAIYETGIEKAGGIKKLSLSLKLRTSQVKQVIAELATAKSAYDKEQAELAELEGLEEPIE